jgi:enediyne biosynthesis protein E4
VAGNKNWPPLAEPAPEDGRTDYILPVLLPHWKGFAFMNRRRVNVVVLSAAALAVSATGLLLFQGCKPPPPTAVEIPSTDDLTLKGPPFFREVEDSGIAFTYRNGEEANNLSILESLGGGIALLDYDGDGKLDVFVTGGGDYEGPEKKTIVGRPCKLYRNLGGFKFKDVTKEVGLEDFAWFYTHGATAADYDRDGWPDLLVTGWGRVALFHNEPVDANDSTKGRKFVDVTDKVGLTGITWATSAAWADFDGDGYPDLYIDQYVDWSWSKNPKCNYGGKNADGESIWDVCPPKQFSGLPHKLFANQAGKTFKDVSDEAGLNKGGPDASKGLGVLAVDVNDDGKPDIYVCNDTVDNFLYINKSTPGNFKFEEVGVRSGTARDDRGVANGSMGADAADYDGCGRPSIWVTNYEDEQHALYHNDSKQGAALFFHRTASSGIGAIGQKYVAWGTSFLDLDHDGWEDLFIANGHAIHFPTKSGSSRRQRPVLLRNQGDGKFKNITARGGPYFEKDHLSRGVGFGDLDDDGRTDAVISQINDPVSILRNEASVEGTHWLGVELVGKDHADVVGAKVRLEDAGGRTQTRFAKGGGSYASSGDRRLLFGLGKEDKVVKVIATWPNRDEQTFEGDALPIDRYYRLVQGKKEPEKPLGQ